MGVCKLNNKKKVSIIVICVVIVLAIIGGVHYHKTHVLDGQWVVKTAGGDTLADNQKVTLTITGNKHFKLDNNGDVTSGDITRNDNTMQFIMKKQRSYTMNETDTANYQLTDDKKEMTLNFQDATHAHMIYPNTFPDNPILLVKK